MPSPFPLTNAVTLHHDYTAYFYVRVCVAPCAVSLVKDIGARAEATGVCIASLQTDTTTAASGGGGGADGSADVILTTAACTLSAITDLARSLQNLPYAISTPIVMPVLQ